MAMGVDPPEAACENAALGRQGSVKVRKPGDGAQAFAFSRRGGGVRMAAMKSVSRFVPEEGSMSKVGKSGNDGREGLSRREFVRSGGLLVAAAGALGYRNLGLAADPLPKDAANTPIHPEEARPHRRRGVDPGPGNGAHGPPESEQPRTSRRSSRSSPRRSTAGSITSIPAASTAAPRKRWGRCSRDAATRSSWSPRSGR
jgi:hypothetical protein